jgi:catechol 2,3-dioxygenase-like lactoylglutathione lyase family enzyme
MAKLDHIILKVNDLQASVAFYRDVLGFGLEGTDGPFTVLRAGAVSHRPFISMI